MKRTRYALMLGALMLLLSGCAFTGSETSLYRLPKLSGEYESLEARLDELLDSGAEYAAPTSGSNLQSVQMVDLDGDGSEEAVAFFRRAGDEKPMKIYIFKAVDDSYEQYAVIEGSAASIYSINYSDLDGDGRRELLVGYKSSSDVQGFAVYPLAEGKLTPLLVTGYSRYASLDLDGEGRQELLIIYSDEQSEARVDHYGWDGAQLRVQGTLHLSMAVAELSRLTVGTLVGGERALFVTGVTADNMTVTDVLTLRDGRLQNIALGPEGTKIPTATPFLGLYPREGDDGVTEVPEAVPLQGSSRTGETLCCAVWQRFDVDGGTEETRMSFHNVADGWDLTLPEEWNREELSAERVSGGGETSVSFYRTDSDGSRWKLLTVYRLTGELREELAKVGDRFTLTRQLEATFAAELGEEWNVTLDEQTLRDRFSLIVAEWNAGDD